MMPVPFIDQFLFVGLPYLAIITFVVGCVWRWSTNRFSYSSLSSQFLEHRQLYWGSVSWHIGILLVLAGHLVALIFPGLWSGLMSVQAALLTVETVGAVLGCVSLAGLVTLLYRRITSNRLQAVTTPLDILVVALLLGQVLLGVTSAMLFPYGAYWAPATVSPYLWGLLTLQPDATCVAFFPAVFKLHLVGAWLLVLLFPFTRLVHIVLLPWQYFFRPPQQVVWYAPRQGEQAHALSQELENRRDFVKGLAGISVAGGLLSLGVFEKLARYFQGHRPDPKVETDLLEKKMIRLKQAAETRELELERQRDEIILVAKYAELQANKGKYLTDYSMAPALAFKGPDGWPLVISAKCTHLGCTVGSEMNGQGKILCPCHISYFDVKTGRPDAGAPAKAPLRHLEWVLIDAQGKEIARKGSGLPATNNPALLAQCSVFIVKPKETR
jgi:nitrate reductase gamma subunit